MTNSRMIGRTLLGATALAAATFTTPAAAQRVDNIVAFGDSYADEGNAFELAGIDPVTTIIYPTGRFTGGFNFNDELANLLSVDVQNFAIGGALTNNSNTSLGLPGFTFEVATFASGGGLVFPTVSGTFDESDLVTVSIGGNDARVYQQTGGDIAGAPAAAATAVANTETNLDVLVGAGASNISFLAGNTALLPEIALDPAAQAVRNAYSTAYLDGVQDVLAGYAANGVIVHYLDLTTMLEQVSANLSAYGFTNAGPCAPIASCLDSNYASQYVFYADALHPTSHTSAVIARYIATQLQAPLTLEAPSELGLDTARQFGRTLNGRADLGSPRDGDVAEGLKLFVVGDTFSRDVNPTFASDGFDIDGVGATAGLSYGFGTGTIGIAGNYSRPRAKFIGDVSRTEADSWQVGAFGGFAIAGAFAQGYLGYGWDNLDIERKGVVEGMRANTDGNHWLAGAKAGYLLPVGIMRAGPVIALDYAKAKVDGYTETGDPTLTLDVSSVTAKSFTGGIGAELRGDFDTGGVSVRPYLSAMLEKELLDNARTVRFAQTTAPGIVNSWSLGDRSKKAYGRISGGGSARILNNVMLNTVLSATVGRDDGNDMSAQVGLNVGF